MSFPVTVLYTFAGVPVAHHVGEASLLVSEILVAINQPSGNQVAQLTVDCCVRWLAARDSSSVVLQAFLRVLGTSVTSSEALGAILEAVLEAFFKHTSR
jgi:ABC-type taurine transport system ATPase subunit